MNSKCIHAIVFLVAGLVANGACGQNKNQIVSQTKISSIACGPCCLFNWLSHGNEELQGVVTELSDGKSPEQTVKHIIKKYGYRKSATKRSGSRYGSHNGGVGSVNLMIMAQEILQEHLDEPPELRGEYLQRHEDESSEAHLKRIAGWFSKSIQSGVPVLFYVRSYKLTKKRSEPTMVFGHHVVITSIDKKLERPKDGIARTRIKIIDPSGGRVYRGFLSVAGQEFTAPTFNYQLVNNRARTTKRVITGRPLLEIHANAFQNSGFKKTNIATAHFATFAGSPE